METTESLFESVSLKRLYYVKNIEDNQICRSHILMNFDEKVTITIEHLEIGIDSIPFISSNFDYKTSSPCNNPGAPAPGDDFWPFFQFTGANTVEFSEAENFCCS